MTADRTDDILSLLEEIHGDGLSRREATVNDAVGQIERSAYRGYSALRDLAQRGTPRLPAQTEPEKIEATEILAIPETPETPETPAEGREPDASEAETRIAARPEKSQEPRNADPIDVISGDGANFRERGHTQTHIIRRPRNWFGRR